MGWFMGERGLHVLVHGYKWLKYLVVYFKGTNKMTDVVDEPFIYFKQIYIQKCLLIYCGQLSSCMLYSVTNINFVKVINNCSNEKINYMHRYLEADILLRFMPKQFHINCIYIYNWPNLEIYASRLKRREAYILWFSYRCGNSTVCMKLHMSQRVTKQVKQIKLNSAIYVTVYENPRPN